MKSEEREHPQPQKHPAVHLKNAQSFTSKTLGDVWTTASETLPLPTDNPNPPHIELEYLPRIADQQLRLRLQAFGAVQIKGPKWCGKTTTASMQASSIIRMQDPDKREGYLATARSKPSLLLKGAVPRLIDEWQTAPVLWDAVRHAVDQRQAKGQFILTGSTIVDDEQILHSGTGRITSLNMYPMSLFESGESNGQISLRALFDDPSPDIDGATSDLSIEQLIFAACRGGWPASLDAMTDQARLLIAQDYVDIICTDDLSRVDKSVETPPWPGSSCAPTPETSAPWPRKPSSSATLPARWRACP